MFMSKISAYRFKNYDLRYSLAYPVRDYIIVEMLPLFQVYPVRDYIF